jgi:hypothetical protein
MSAHPKFVTNKELPKIDGNLVEHLMTRSEFSDQAPRAVKQSRKPEGRLRIGSNIAGWMVIRVNAKAA